MYRSHSMETVKAYGYAKERYSELGVDTDLVLKRLRSIPVSINCWQGDDLAGFEGLSEGVADGGILSTGSQPGRARTGDELRKDLDKAMSLIPGSHKVNLHAIYAETDGRNVDRDELDTWCFERWIEWAKDKKIGLDFNPTFFSHDKSASGYTLSSDDPDIRGFWIRHAKKSRKIASDIGKELECLCINNLWIPDGSKDSTPNRYMRRMLLKDSLDEIYRENYKNRYMLDCVESKLFGIGSEDFVVGSNEFYLGYALCNKVSLCYDMGHFHPTESVADKISSILAFMDDMLLHVSRAVRWDSDHVAMFNDELRSVMNEVKRADAFDRVHLAVDFFDGSINRVTAWVIGVRNTLKAVLYALLEPTGMIRDAEKDGDLGRRLAILEECRTLPFTSVWEEFCRLEDVPAGLAWLDVIEEYERKVLNERQS